MAKESIQQFQGASTARVPIKKTVRTNVARTALPPLAAGKGDKPRPVEGPKYRSNFDRIFNKKKEETQNEKTSS